MSVSDQLKLEIKRPFNGVFRRLYIKRRNAVTGLFEDNWQEITNDVKKWGSITFETDSVRLNKFNFSGANITVANDSGRYNPSSYENSLWFGFLDRQRSLVKIEAGFFRRIKGHDGIWTRIEQPADTLWDRFIWDRHYWDQTSVLFLGIISGDIDQSDDNQVVLPVKPILDVLRQYSARNLTGYTSTGMTASHFMEMIRDHQDVNGNYIFRPFFGDTTTNWEIQTTTAEYNNLNTSTAQDVIDAKVWDVVTKLAEAENFVAYVTPDGKFKFKERSANTTTAAFEFHGRGSLDQEYGHTIKKIKKFGPKISKFYSRVQVKWRDEDTSTSFAVVESTMTVSGTNNTWIYGERTYEVENIWIPSATVAQTIAQNIFNDYSALKNEIELEASFVPRISIFDRVTVTYDTSEIDPASLWDMNEWAADDTDTSTDLIFDPFSGDAISLRDEEFNTIRIQQDIDNFVTIFHGRET